MVLTLSQSFPDLLLLLCPTFVEALRQKSPKKAVKELQAFFKQIHPFKENRFAFHLRICDVILFQGDSRSLERRKKKGVAFQSHFPLLLLLLQVKDCLVNLFSPLQGCAYFTEVILRSGDCDFLYAAFTTEGQEQAVIEVGDKTVASDRRSRLIY